ncbi:MAG: DNA-directed RNA polymerase subunit delta [Firmicutes bacterium]|nr:DNA-directed RNA polymerase subunit delta [Bacillota bacterium]
MRAVDIAYEVLKAHGQALDVQELLDLTLERMGLDREPRKAAQIYTEINLDPRFHYRGGNLWELRDWQPRAQAVGRGSAGRERAVEPEAAEEIDEDESWT